MTLDPAGLEAAAKALGEVYGGRMAEDAPAAEAAVSAYLAAVVPVTCPECGTEVPPRYSPEASGWYCGGCARPVARDPVPVTPTTENPTARQVLAEAFDGVIHHACGPDDWAAGHALDALAAAGFSVVAGRAAATETIPREDALQALHEMSTVAGLLRVRRDDPAVVALGDRLRLACRALRDVTAPGMNELMDSQPGRAAATPDAECPERFPLTGGTLEAVLTVGDIREVVPAPAATPDPPSDRNIARMFHEVYERLAPTFGYRTREESAVPWEKVPAKNRDLMTATVGAVRAHLAAASPDERLREAAERLLVAFAAEEDEHGFPFSFELRDAHRALVAATDRDKPGQRPWATDEDYAAEHAEKPKRNHAPWCEGGHGDTPCPATDRDKPETDT